MNYTEGNITAKDVLNLFEKMDDRNSEYIKNVADALARLDEVKVELQKARDVYEKGIFGFIRIITQSNPKLYFFGLLFVFAIFLAGLICMFKDTQISYKDLLIKSCKYENK
jgi:hypothetical protein